MCKQNVFLPKPCAECCAKILTMSTSCVRRSRLASLLLFCSPASVRNALGCCWCGFSRVPLAAQVCSEQSGQTPCTAGCAGSQGVPMSSLRSFSSISCKGDLFQLHSSPSGAHVAQGFYMFALGVLSGSSWQLEACQTHDRHHDESSPVHPLSCTNPTLVTLLPCLCNPCIPLRDERLR